MTARSLHLIARPVGLPQTSDFELRPVAEAPLAEGQIRVRNRYVSLDPAMRIWMSEQKSYWPPIGLGEVMRAFTLGEVVESTNSRIPVGHLVAGMLGVAEEVIHDGRGLQAFGPNDLPDPTLALGVLGPTGITAYFGLFDIGQPKAGETVVVSAAAGAVGSAVVQLAKLRGCKVIGIAGGAEKCAFVTDTLGADAAIDYKAGPIGKSLSKLCPEGVDVYFDNVGGDILDAVLARLRLKARIVVCGGISQYNAEGPARGPANYLALISARARMEGFVVIDYFHRNAEAMAEMLPWVKQGKLHNAVDVLPGGIEAFVPALHRLFKGENTGKQLLALA